MDNSNTMEHNTGFSEDPEEATHLISKSTRKASSKLSVAEDYFKPLTIPLILILSLILIAYYLSPSNGSANLKMLSAATGPGLKPYMVRNTPFMPVKEGCAYLYPTLPVNDSIVPAAYRICNFGLSNLGESELTTVDNIVLAQGIEYIVTGPNCWLTLYEEGETRGVHTNFGPEVSMYLAENPDGDWSGKVQSLTVRQKIGDQAFLVKNCANIVPGDNCALLYGSDPNIVPSTKAVEICAKYGDPWSSEFAYSRLLNQYSLDVTKIGMGISYVATGRLAMITLYSEDGLGGTQLTLPANGRFNLKDQYDQDNKKGIDWEDVPLSFKLYIKQLSPPSPPPTMPPVAESGEGETGGESGGMSKS